MENFETVSVPVSAAVAGGSCGLSHVWFFVIPWTVAHNSPPSMGFSRQESWSRLPFPPPGESSRSRDRTCVSCISCIVRQIVYHETTWEFPVPELHQEDSFGKIHGSFRSVATLFWRDPRVSVASVRFLRKFSPKTGPSVTLLTMRKDWVFWHQESPRRIGLGCSFYQRAGSFTPSF